MGYYSFFLFFSNYFAPTISGFITDRQGWTWVFWWPTIFLAFGIVFCFLFMEETTYLRGPIHDPADSIASQTPDTAPVDHDDTEKQVTVGQVRALDQGPVQFRKRSFVEKLSLWNRFSSKPFLVGSWRILYYLSWPTVFYAG